MQNLKRKVIISVINDLVTDQRVNRVATTLYENGYDVLLVGRLLPGSPSVENRKYSTKRLNLIFTRGPLFYLEMNIRLFFFLLSNNFDIALSNDLDTLFANYWASKLKNKQLVYDSHELFTEVPELINRSFKQNIWKSLERKILPKLKYAYTVNQSLADYYYDKYKIKMSVIRNVPFLNKNDSFFDELIFKKRTKVVLYQGALNLGRGIELIIETMQYIENSQLVIIGDGDIKEKILKLIDTLELKDKVKFLGRIPMEELKNYTIQADLGVSLEEDMGMNYRFALPNKLFDYIHAGVPVLTSSLPEIKKIVEDYQVGKCVETRVASELAEEIKNIFDDTEMYKKWKMNTVVAKNELNWESESKILLNLFNNIN